MRAKCRVGDAMIGITGTKRPRTGTTGLSQNQSDRECC
jgi:hypothetical protein